LLQLDNSSLAPTDEDACCLEPYYGQSFRSDRPVTFFFPSLFFLSLSGSGDRWRRYRLPLNYQEVGQLHHHAIRSLSLAAKSRGTNDLATRPAIPCNCANGCCAPFDPNRVGYEVDSFVKTCLFLQPLQLQLASNRSLRRRVIAAVAMAARRCPCPYSRNPRDLQPLSISYLSRWPLFITNRCARVVAGVRAPPP
jgi:hypothetical protein